MGNATLGATRAEPVAGRSGPRLLVRSSSSSYMAWHANASAMACAALSNITPSTHSSIHPSIHSVCILCASPARPLPALASFSFSLSSPPIHTARSLARTAVPCGDPKTTPSLSTNLPPCLSPTARFPDLPLYLSPSPRISVCHVLATPADPSIHPSLWLPSCSSRPQTASPPPCCPGRPSASGSSFRRRSTTRLRTTRGRTSTTMTTMRWTRSAGSRHGARPWA